MPLTFQTLARMAFGCQQLSAAQFWRTVRRTTRKQAKKACMMSHMSCALCALRWQKWLGAVNTYFLIED
jgi:hypothetical protein